MRHDLRHVPCFMGCGQQRAYFTEGALEWSPCIVDDDDWQNSPPIILILQLIFKLGCKVVRIFRQVAFVSSECRLKSAHLSMGPDGMRLGTGRL